MGPSLAKSDNEAKTNVMLPLNCGHIDDLYAAKNNVVTHFVRTDDCTQTL
jgi:hypothetical protein